MRFALVLAMRVERVPLRPIEQVGSRGKRRRRLSVYCPFRARSFEAEHCRTCARCLSWAENEEAHGASIVCASDGEATAARAESVRPGRFRDKLATDAPIGLVMPSSVVVVHHDLELETLRRELAGQTGRAFPVVSDDGRLLGVVAADQLAPAPPASRARRDLRELLSMLEPSTVGEVMGAHVVAFPESGSVADALDLMITERVRYLPIVTAEEEVCGLVWDLNILSWLARARREGGHERGD
jgi:CBS domain-containing protein